VWLRSPCGGVAYWECPPDPLGAPWLLIEMCAWSLVTDAQRGVPWALLEPDSPFG
jgi:hypothetical protein